MPNPRAQQQLAQISNNPLDRAVHEIKSIATPMKALADMMAGTLRGSTAATLGAAGDIESLGRGALSAARAPSGQRLDAFISGSEQPTFMPTTERMSEMMPKATSEPGTYETLGQMIPLPGSATAAKAASYGLGRGAGALTREAARAINDAHIYGQGPLAAITPQPMRMFIGPQAKTFNHQAAAKAQEMLQAGVPPEQVWRETGTMMGKDGILRQEISDAGSTFRSPTDLRQLEEQYKAMIEAGKEKLRPDRSGQKDLFPKHLTEAKKPFREELAALKEDMREIGRNPRTQGVSARWTLEHPELYRAYPELADIPVTQKPTIGAEKGSLSTIGGVIQGLEVRDIKDPRSVALHELQHAVQNREGMALGASPMMAFSTPEYKKFYETYKNAELAGLPEGTQLSTKDDDRLANKAAMEWYKRQHGEAEARATQDRRNMGQTERQQSFPYNAYDINPNDALIRKGPPFLGVAKDEELATGGTPKPPDAEMREKLKQLRDSFIPAANEYERQKKIQDNLEKMNGKISISDNPDTMMMELNEQQFAGGGEVRGYDDGGSIKATPRSEGWGVAADIAKAIEGASKEQFGYKNPVTEFVADLFSVPAIARTLERKAYGEPLTNFGKANVPLLPDDTAETLMAAAPFAGSAARGAKAVGKAGLGEVEKALFGESRSKLLNAATPQVMSVYKPHTPSKPDPEVGKRYKKEYIGGLAPRKDLDIEDLQKQKASVKIFPWDATSRNQLITEVSEVPLTKPVLTEGGDEYMMDLEHIKNRIAGASNEGIAKRIKDRIDQASVENQILGGSGRVYGFPIRMGDFAENAATFPTDVAMDLLKQGKLKKSELKELDSSLRNMVFEGDKGVFKNMAPIGTPEFEQQLRTGLKGDKSKDIQGFTAMNLRKGLMNRLGLVEYQKRLGYNLPDLTGAVLSDELKGVPKGYVGNVSAELDPFVDIRPSKSSTYSHDFSGQYSGSMPNMPVEFLMPNTYEGIYKEMKFKYPKSTPEALRNMTIGAMEKRKDKISELISPRSVDATKVYQEGLMKGEFDPNDIKQVYDYMRRKKLQLKLKSGGAVGHQSHDDFKRGKKDDGTVQAIGKDQPAPPPPPSMMGMAKGGQVAAEDLVIEERPL